MIGWWCANISFWCAAGFLAALGAVEAVAALRESRRSDQRQAGEAAG